MPVSSPVPGVPSGSVIVNVTEMFSVEVFWVPWSVFVPSMVVAMVPGTVFCPTWSSPRL